MSEPSQAAREAAEKIWDRSNPGFVDGAEINAYAAIIQQAIDAERERCAGIAEGFPCHPQFGKGKAAEALDIAAAIRA